MQHKICKDAINKYAEMVDLFIKSVARPEGREGEFYDNIIGLWQSTYADMLAFKLPNFEEQTVKEFISEATYLLAEVADQHNKHINSYMIVAVELPNNLNLDAHNSESCKINKLIQRIESDTFDCRKYVIWPAQNDRNDWDTRVQRISLLPLPQAHCFDETDDQNIKFELGAEQLASELNRLSDDMSINNFADNLLESM